MIVIIIVAVLGICAVALTVLLIKMIVARIRGGRPKPEPGKGKPIVDTWEDDEEDPSTILIQKEEEEDDNEPTLLMRADSDSVRIQLISDTTGDVLSAVCHDQITIGRKSICDIQISGDKAVSGVHCIIKRMEDGTFSVCDSNSSNGTYLNDRKTAGEEYITNGDTLEIGRTRYKVQIN